MTFTSVLVGSLIATSPDLPRLQENLARVDRSIEETETLLARTPTARYVPELRLRLCELMVEKSRLVFGIKAAENPDDLGPIASPEVRLLKEKAVSMYDRLMREYPKFDSIDKVRFYMAHEQRELGRFDDMVTTLKTLVKKHPRSLLAREAELILGDHFFDKSNLDEAEKHYRWVLKQRPVGPSHDLARYKLGWIEVNRSRHDRALTFFESVVTGRSKSAEDSKKVLDVRREALVDLVYSYTEVKKPAGALAYFERLSDSTTTYALVLDKLATRYVVKSQFEAAVPVLRKILSLRADPERDEERVLALYDALKNSAGKATPTALDISFFVRAAIEVRKQLQGTPTERAERLQVLEQCARDLSTKLHLLAQKKDDKRLFLEASNAYAHYLGLFRPAAHVRELMKNRSDSLFAARKYTDAARQFEQLARLTDGVDETLHEEAMYGALLSYKSSVAEERLPTLTRFQVVDAREAIKRSGSAFCKRYPENKNVPDIRFNIARAHFDDGEYPQASEQFLAFALNYPEHKDATVAGHLAIDASYRTRNFQKLNDIGQQLLASNLPESFKAETRKVLKGVDSEALSDMALASAQKTGDVVSGLEKIANNSKDQSVAAKALQGAMLAAREKGQWDKELELVRRLVSEYPDLAKENDFELQVAQRALETARFAEASEWFEQAAQSLEGKKAVDALRTAGSLALAMGDLERGSNVLESIAGKISKLEKADLYAELAEAWLAADDLKRAEQCAKRAFGADKSNARAAAVLAQVHSEEQDSVAEALATADGESAARGLWHLVEPQFESFTRIDSLEQKVAAFGELEQAYSQVIGKGSAEYTVASLWRLGLAFQNLASSLLEVPVPKDVDPAEFRAATQQQADPLKERAESTFALCAQKADQQGVFSEAAAGCRTKSAEVKVTSFKMAPKPGKIAIPEEVQRKIDLRKDANALSAVATLWLDKGNPAMARLAFARALEADKSIGAAHTGLGYALLRLGEPSLAAAAYREALTVDPSNAIAHGNLAALKCRFGDFEGARVELDQVTDKGVLKGPTADPEWKGCVETLTQR
jgi:tetratricopeptide (TPR) repeat protein